MVVCQVFHRVDQQDDDVFTVQDQIFNTFQSAGDDADQAQHRMLAGWLVDLHQLKEKSILKICLKEKYVIPYQLINQILAQLWRDLQGVDSEAEQDFNYAFNITLFLSLNQLASMFYHDSL